jgi:multisubunit Na+/H+ antiporter MnhG subunit
MDWKLVLIGAVMTLVGGLIVWRFRKSPFNRELPAGCAMSFGVLLLGVGLLSLLFGLL